MSRDMIKNEENIRNGANQKSRYRIIFVVLIKYMIKKKHEYQTEDL